MSVRPIKLLRPGALAALALWLGSSTAAATPATSTLARSLPAWPNDLEPTAQITATANVGTLEGEFNVTDAGSAHYAIPLVTPPGPGGFAPALALSYDSAAGNGPFGVGFSMSEQSAIARCQPNLAIDGFVAAVAFTDKDALCLDGERLILIAGDHLQVGAEYRLRRDDFSRVRLLARSSCPSGVVFERRRADGVIDTYGCTDDSLELTSLGVRRWARSLSEDRFGNFTRYAYAFETAMGPSGSSRVDHRLTAIEYGGHTSAPALAPNRRIDLDWEPRPDVHRGFAAGLAVARTLRVREIRSSVDGELVRRWPLSYGEAAMTGRSRIDAVTECAADGACRPATTFTWIDGELAADDASVNEYSFDGAPFPYEHNTINGDPIVEMYTFLDANGDGLSDILGATGGAPPPSGRGWELWTMQPHAGLVQGAVCPPNQPACSPDHYRLREGERTQIVSVARAPQAEINVGQSMFAFDYDGDGRDDAVAPSPSGAYWLMEPYPSMAIGSFLIVRATDEAIEQQQFYVSEGPDPAWVYAAADLTGDGLGDLLYCQGDDDEADFANFTGRWRLVPNQPGVGFELAARVDTDLGCSAHDKLLVLDHDGDGVASVLVVDTWDEQAQARLPVSSWHNYHAITFAPDLSSAELIDTGLPPDVAQRWRSTPLDYSNGYLVDQDFPYYGSAIGIDRILDIQGDGLPDIVRYQLEWGDDVAQSQAIAPWVLELLGFELEKGGLRLWINEGGRFHDGGWLTLGEPGTMLFTEFTSSTTLDWNGDGLLDLLKPRDDDDQWWVWLAQGDGTMVEQPIDGAPAWPDIGSSYPRAIASMDVDGDGLHDPVYWSFAEGASWDLWRHRGEQPDRVSRIVDGLGQAIEVEYASITDYERPDLHDGDVDGCAWPQSCKPQPRIVVERHRIDTGLAPGQFREYRHRYSDSRHDRLERRWLGFARHDVTEVVELDGEVVELGQHTRWFANDEYDSDLAAATRAGVVVAELEQRRDPDTGRVWASGVTIEHEITPTSPRSYHVAQSYSLSRTWEMAGCFAQFCEWSELSEPLTQQTHQVYTFDEFGHALHERTVVAIDGAPNLATDVTRTIVNDKQEWLLGQVTAETVTGIHDGETVEQLRIMAYDPTTGALASETREPGEIELIVHTILERDAFGNIRSTISMDGGGDARGGTLRYDPRGVHPVATINALGHITQIDWHAGLGVPQAVVDPNGVRTVIDYDGFGRTTGMRTFAGGVPRGDETTIEYLPGDQPGIALRIRSAVAGHGWRRVDHDRLGRPIASAWLGADGKARYSWRNFDALGRLAAESLPGFEDQVSLDVETWRYDSINRPIMHMMPDGSFEQWLYKDREVEHRDVAGERRRTTYDGAWRMVETVGAPGTPDEERLCYDYGPFSWLVAVRPDCVLYRPEVLAAPDGEAPPMIKLYEYDRRGALVYSDDPSEGERVFTWNGFGELTDVFDANDEHVSHVYDGLGRLIERIDSDGVTRWVWDLDKLGTLAYSKTPTGITDVYTYDAFARIVDLTKIVTDEGFSLGFVYDELNRISSVHYPTGADLPPVFVRNVYGANGDLVEVRRGVADELLWRADLLDAAGRITHEHFGNGITTTRSFDPLLGNLLAIRSFGAQPQPIQDLRYTWNPIGTLASREDQRLGQLEQFGYDALHRLAVLEVENGQGQAHNRHFAYDSLGNLAYATDIGDYEYDGRGLLAWAGGVSHEWDGNANLITRTTADDEFAFDYTSFGKPRRITPSVGDPTLFDYDADERRALRIDGETGMQTVYLASFYERDREPGVLGDREEHRFFVHGRDRVIAQIDYEVSPDLIVTERTRYVHVDHLGSTDVITDEQGEVVQRLSFDAWGKTRDPLDWTTPDEFAVEFEVNLGFTGHEARRDAGLINMQGRLYDPRLGRMASADPFVVDASSTQGWNRFAYVLNDPLSAIDPTGFADEDPDAGGGGDGESTDYEWASVDSTKIGPDGSKVTTSSGTNPESGNHEMVVEVAGQPTEVAGPSTDAGPEADSRGTTARDVGLGVLDGIGNTGMAVSVGGPALTVGMVFPPVAAAAIGGYWATGGNPFGALRRFAGGLLGSETLSANPDSFAYHGSMFVTEAAAAAAAGLVGPAVRAIRSSAARAFGSCDCGGAVAAGLEAAAAGTCFVAGTQVLTAEGLRAIETVRAGDRVLAGALVDGELVLIEREVVGTSARLTDTLILLDIEADGEVMTFEVTPEHPFFLPSYGRYFEAEALQVGDAVLLDSGALARVRRLERRGGEFEVFNLEVDGAHNYFAAPIGEQVAVLVHNNCGEKAAQAAANRIAGAWFERLVLRAINASKNTAKISGTTASGAPGNAIPDVVGPSALGETGLVEIKNRLVVAFTRQMQIQHSAAQQAGVPLNVIVSPRIRTVTTPMRDAVRETGGKIEVLNPATGVRTPYKP